MYRSYKHTLEQKETKDEHNKTQKTIIKEIDKLYIEGVGTAKDGETSTVKAGRYYGVKEKVNEEIAKLSDLIEQKITKTHASNITIELDIFGFSRGSASARITS